LGEDRPRHAQFVVRDRSHYPQASVGVVPGEHDDLDQGIARPQVIQL
jgi:hypothetical protein